VTDGDETIITIARKPTQSGEAAMQLWGFAVPHDAAARHQTDTRRQRAQPR
jgi:hypothetical protein